MGQPMLFWLKGIHFVPFHRLKNVVVLKKKFVQQLLNAYLCLSRVQLPLYHNKEEEGSLMSPRNIRDHGASFEVGVLGEGAKLKPAGTPYLQALKNSLGKTLSQSKLLLIETEVVSFTVKNPEQFFQ